jgi:predicted nucleotidyltransferase
MNNRNKIVEYLKQQGLVSPGQISEFIGISKEMTHRYLKKLVEEKIIEKKGSAPKTYYFVKYNNKTYFEQLSSIASPILSKYPITYAGVFGSVARGEEKSNSDVDILIDYRRPFSLISLVALERALSEALGKKVDLVTENGANKHMKSNILKDLKIFYGSR